MKLISALLATILTIAPLLCGADSTWAAAASGANEKLAALKKAAQTEGMLNLVWGENTFRGLQGVRDLVSGMNKHFGTSIIANWTPGPSQPQMAAKIAQEFAAGVPATSDVYIGGSETYIATLSTPLMVSSSSTGPRPFRRSIRPPCRSKAPPWRSAAVFPASFTTPS